MNVHSFAADLCARYQDEIIQVARDLISIPSQNMPPEGEEKACQEYIADFLAGPGLPVDMYNLDRVPGLRDHRDYWPGRNYTDRPNLSSVLAGRRGGRSLLLTGHCDTVALGENEWSKPPFGAEIDQGRLFGLGALDMKGALGAMLVLFKAVAVEDVPLLGSLTFESVVDEEEAGVNGTIAGRLRGGHVDGAVIGESTDLKVYPAARGSLIVHVLFGSHGTWLDVGRVERQLDAVEQIGVFLTHLGELRQVRRSHGVPALYENYPNPAPVEVTKVYAGGWGSKVPIGVPPEGRVEVILQTLPGEDCATVLKEFKDWLDSVVERNQRVFPEQPRLQFARRWMHPTEIDTNHPLVSVLSDSVAQVVGTLPQVVGAPYPCDLWALQRSFNIPAVVFGPKGANAHAVDECVELDSLFSFWKALMLFVLNWCGVG